MNVGVTGANGFLGTHVALRAEAAGFAVQRCARVESATPESLSAKLANCATVIHCAGVNRGKALDVTEMNLAIARILAAALPESCRRLVFANSVAAGDGSPYGTGKAAASEILRSRCAAKGIEYDDVQLPNLYGEGGRPHYNSVTATFVQAAVTGQPLSVIQDRELWMLHVSAAADVLLGLRSVRNVSALGEGTTVTGLRNLVLRQVAEYRTGNLPGGDTSLDRHVFNMIRDLLPVNPPFIQPVLHADDRGYLFEGARHFGRGQVFFSESAPGARRGDHYHVRKFERFMIISGQATLTCRDLLGRRGQYQVALSSTGGSRIADMHTFEVHTLQNVGTDPLIAAFWVSEHFDPSCPDTVPHRLDLSLAPA